MKKRFIRIFLAVAIMLAVSACAKTNADYVDDYCDIMEEIAEAAEKGDTQRIEELTKEADAVFSKIEIDSLTDAQHDQIMDASLRALVNLPVESR